MKGHMMVDNPLNKEALSFFWGGGVGGIGGVGPLGFPSKRVEFSSPGPNLCPIAMATHDLGCHIVWCADPQGRSLETYEL